MTMNRYDPDTDFGMDEITTTIGEPVQPLPCCECEHPSDDNLALAISLGLCALALATYYSKGE